MKATLISVDFVHEDCDESQMMLHVRCPIGGITTGEVEIFWPNQEPKSLADTLRAMTAALTGTDDRDIQQGLFSITGHKPSHYCECVRRSLLAFMKCAANRTFPVDREISFAAAMLGVECPPIVNAWQELRDAVLRDPQHDSDDINWALGMIDQFAPQGSLE